VRTAFITPHAQQAMHSLHVQMCRIVLLDQLSVQFLDIAVAFASYDKLIPIGKGSTADLTRLEDSTGPVTTDRITALP